MFDERESYRVLCLKMFHKVSLVWQLYRVNLRGKVTIPGTLCGTNRMTNCWKSHSPVYDQRISADQRMSADQTMSVVSPGIVHGQLN